MKSHSAKGPELFFGLVGAVGTDLDLVIEVLEEVLREVAYDISHVHVIELLNEFDRWSPLPDSPLFDRYWSRMDAGDEFRGALERNDALAVLAARAVRDRKRKERTKEADRPADRTAYVFRSLKTPEEVETLREIYGDGFFLIGAYSPRSARLSRLAELIAKGGFTAPDGDDRAQAERLIERDERDSASWGQNVRSTFPKSDVFVDVSQGREKVRTALKRFVELLFAYPYHTPSYDEFAMYHADAAAMRSAELGRQVGAVLTKPDGEILATGCNEVPKVGGGSYWPDDDPDHREFRKGHDSSDEQKRHTVAEIIEAFVGAGWITSLSKVDEKVVEQAVGVLGGSRVMNLTEYGRAAHAEMDALLTAARRGVSVTDATLFTTTFPCHNCTRHLIAAGVKRVVFIEPYAKSLAGQLHKDEIVLEGEASDARLPFDPFVGVAPRQFARLFRMTQRKESDGTVIRWDGRSSYPRLSPAIKSYLQEEDHFGGRLRQQLDDSRLTLAKKEKT